MGRAVQQRAQIRQRKPVKITADTNVLVRALVQAELVGVPLPVLCELVWVLRRVYRFSASVRVDRSAVGVGLQLLAAGGDFADGVIAYGGRQLGSEQLVTFDQEAARLLAAVGEPVILL